MTQQIKPKYRINILMAVLLMGTAVTFWGVQVLCSLTGVGEIVSELIGIVANILFFVWFLFLGINYFGKNSLSKLGIVIGMDTLELIPFLNDIPAIVIEVFVLILISRKEDEEKAIEEAKAAHKAAEEQAEYYAQLHAANESSEVEESEEY